MKNPLIAAVISSLFFAGLAGCSTTTPRVPLAKQDKASMSNSALIERWIYETGSSNVFDQKKNPTYLESRQFAIKPFMPYLNNVYRQEKMTIIEDQQQQAVISERDLQIALDKNKYLVANPSKSQQEIIKDTHVFCRNALNEQYTSEIGRRDALAVRVGNQTLMLQKRLCAGSNIMLYDK